MKQNNTMENMKNLISNVAEQEELSVEEINKEETSNLDNTSNKESVKEQSYSEKELKESLDIVNALLKKHNSHAEYSMHDKFKNVIMIKIVDTDSGRVLQEVPPKKILDMIAKMCEMVGIMVDKKA